MPVGFCDAVQPAIYLQPVPSHISGNMQYLHEARVLDVCAWPVNVPLQDNAWCLSTVHICSPAAALIIQVHNNVICMVAPYVRTVYM